uniref:Aminopeptidase n=1 Tax=Myripristis murdjan TaxID=586833 RepID=A0A667XK05_9TELE
MEFEKQDKRYCISGKHAAIIGITIVVCSLAVGLGVGLTCSDTTPAPTPSPTEEPPQPPPADRGPCKASTDSSGDWNNFRLPSYVNPVHYDLHLEPDLSTDLYTGSVAVHLKVSKPTRHLWLHIRETFVTAVPKLELKNQAGQTEVPVKRCFEYKAQQYVVVEAEKELAATGVDEEYVLHLDFQGWLNGSVVGFYRVIYIEDGVTKKIAATDHEPTDARKSFPCFDEPNKKATYKISITHDAAYQALSNMPIEVNRRWTYCIYTKCPNISTSDKLTAVYSLCFLDTDKIAIPDFGTGAMENWGLITYRETNLLYDESQSSSYNKQRVASVIAHELVHQWFGNIVTMDWWDDLWLNEGFASFFEYIGVEKAEPTWGMRDIMIISDVLPVMVDDALLSSHPIIVDVSTPAEITSVFDAISYSKKYLRDFEFRNAKTADFWASLVSGLPVADVMDTWTKQMGYPVLDVAVSGTGARLRQKRFLLDPLANPNEPASPFSYKWTIPVKWHSIESNKNSLVMFDKSELVIGTYSPATDGLLKVNSDHTGFYRVNHDDQMWSIISQQLQNNHSGFDAADRTSFIDDVFALGRADVVDYGNAFNLTRYLQNETDYIVWDRVSSSTAYVRNMLQDNDALYPKFQTLFRGHVKDISNRLGWQDEGTQTERLLRESVLGIACQMGDEDALREASRIFDQWIAGSVSVAVNLRLLVYRYGMKNSGSEEKWNIMFQRYKDTTLAQERDKLLHGLASVENVTLLYKLLEATKDESVMKSQDLFTVVRYVSSNPLGKDMSWDWTTLNWDYLVNRYTINDRNLGRLLTQITTTYNTDLQLWKMEHFFSRTPDAGAGEMPRKQALETVRNNIEWVRRNENEIRSWLESNDG